MNLVSKIIIIVFVLAVFSCTTKEIIVKPVQYNYQPSDSNSTYTKLNDTTIIKFYDITIKFYSSSPCSMQGEVFTFWVASSPFDSSYQFKWTANNKTIGYGLQVSCIFNYMGNYPLQFEVSKDNKIFATISGTLFAWGNYQKNDSVSFYTQYIDDKNRNLLFFNTKRSSNSESSIINYIWNWNDGTKNDTTSQNTTSHEFPRNHQDKIYFVQLTTITASKCTSSLTQPIKIDARYNVNCAFTFSQTNPCKPSTEVFTFIADTTNVPVNALYKWNFSDKVDTILSKNTFKKQFAYNMTQTAQLFIVVNGITQCSSGSIAFQSYGQNVTPSVYNDSSLLIRIGDTLIYKFTSHEYNVQNMTAITNRTWDFGDGNSYSGYNVTQYNAYQKQSTQKTYRVILTVKNEVGCSASDTSFIIIPKK